jgi:septal ring factor EnvC (AmiA/AmiB activator)
MSTTPTLALFASACLALAATQDPKPEDTAGRLAAVEAELASHKSDLANQKKVNETLSRDLADLRGVVEKTVRYVEEQSKAASAMAQTLEASEKAGFTYGINPDSRTILLRGWREALATAQKDVPALKPGPARDAAPQ